MRGLVSTPLVQFLARLTCRLSQRKEEQSCAVTLRLQAASFRWWWFFFFLFRRCFYPSEQSRSASSLWQKRPPLSSHADSRTLFNYVGMEGNEKIQKALTTTFSLSLYISLRSDAFHPKTFGKIGRKEDHAVIQQQDR